MKKTLYIIGLIVIVVLGWYLFKKDSQSTNKETIKVGGILILSGEGASWGEAARNGINMAIEEVNSNGGVDGKNIEVVYEDDGSDPQKGISAFNKLTTSDGVKFIIGPNWSNVGLALTDLIKSKKVVTISPSLGLAKFNEENQYAFNTWPHDYILSEHLAEYVYAQGHRKVALIGAQDIWVKDQTKAFSDKFKSLGGTVELTYEPQVDIKDIRTELSKIKSNKNIDAVVLTTDGYSLTNIAAKQIREFGINLPLFNITVDNKILADCAGFCEGMVFPTFLTPSKQFETKYKARYNREVELGADSGYDALMLLVQAFKKVGYTDTDKVQQYLHTVTEYKGVSGDLISDGKGAFTKDYLIKKVVNSLPVTIQK